MPEGLYYSILFQGHLGPELSSWLGDFDFRNFPDGTTELRGNLPDQAALFGVLLKLRDIGLPLISVMQGRPQAG